MNKNIKLLIVILAGLFILVGCAPQQPPENTSTPAPTPTQQDENGDVNDNEGKQEQFTEANTPEGVKDGQYTGRSETDERGGYGVVTLTVENGEITEVDFEEFTSDDKVKSEENGYEYEVALKAFEELPNELLEKQDILEVDDYTGATSTTDKFRTATKRALGQGVATENEDKDN